MPGLQVRYPLVESVDSTGHSALPHCSQQSSGNVLQRGASVKLLAQSKAVGACDMMGESLKTAAFLTKIGNPKIATVSRGQAAKLNDHSCGRTSQR